MKLFATLGLSLVTALSITACNIKIDDPKAQDNGPVFDFKAVEADTDAIEASEKRLSEEFGIHFVSVGQRNGTTVYEQDMAAYNSHLAKHRDVDQIAMNSRIKKESLALDVFMTDVQTFLKRYPEKFSTRHEDGRLVAWEDREGMRYTLQMKFDAANALKKERDETLNVPAAQAPVARN